MKTTQFNKFILSRALSIIFLAFVAVSCTKSTDPAAISVVGDWKLSGLLQKEDNNAEEDVFPLLALFGGKCITDITYIFKADGTLTTNNPASCKGVLDDDDFAMSGKWATSGTKFTTTDSKGAKDEYDYTVSATELTLAQTVKETDPNTKKVVTTKTTLKFKKA